MSLRIVANNAGLSRCSVRRGHVRPPSVDHTSLNAAPTPMLYSRPPGFAEDSLQFFAFDAGYIEVLRKGLARRSTLSVISPVLHLKSRSAAQILAAIEDVRQGPCPRAGDPAQRNGLRQPERLAAFVNTVCTRCSSSNYRTSSRSESLDADDRRSCRQPEPSARHRRDAQLGKSEGDLAEMPAKDRRLLKADFLDEKDREGFAASRWDGGIFSGPLFRAKRTSRRYVKDMGGIPMVRFAGNFPEPITTSQTGIGVRRP